MKGKKEKALDEQKHNIAIIYGDGFEEDAEMTASGGDSLKSILAKACRTCGRVEVRDIIILLRELDRG